MKSNKVFIATSLDGYISDKTNGLAWLDTFPEINTIDSGYDDFMARVDALLMGRNTFETVCDFDIPWPYKKQVFVASNSMDRLPSQFTDKAELVKGSANEILNQIHAKGYNKLYIDGGKLIQSFLKEDLIDEMIITIIPILLGGGTALFSSLPNPVIFKCIKTELFLDKIVQNHFVRIKNIEQ
jgi:dihydrofolate reductase